jgi:O-antigen ligase
MLVGGYNKTPYESVATTGPSMMAERAAWRTTWLETPIPALLKNSGRWLLLIALPAAMITPRIQVGGVHVTASDVLGLMGGVSWLLACVTRPTARISLAGAKWPLLVLVAGSLSLVSSPNRAGTMVGVAELGVLWLLPAIAVPNLFDSSAGRRRLLTSISLGSVLAGIANLWTAMMVGFANGIPQVWGPADYYQGYFQVLGLSVAVPRLVGAVTERRFGGGLLWTAAAALNSAALLITQTRGAWLAAVAAMLMLVLLLRGALAPVVVVLLGALLAFAASADWGEIIRERAQSIFSLEARLTGFDSSVIRLGLALSAWRMFLAHPLVGVGLKAFPTVVSNYAPPGLPDAVEMGPNHVYTPIEGPHSTYLRLLSETGVLGTIALLGWEFQAVLRLYRRYRSTSTDSRDSRTQVLTLIAALAVVVIYNGFSEMNGTGALPLVCVLAMAYPVPDAGAA